MVAATTSASPPSTSRAANSTQYYNGYCNGTLWPLFHYFPERLPTRAAAVRGLSRRERAVRRQLLTLLEPDDAVWVHDYHLIPLAR